MVSVPVEERKCMTKRDHEKISVRMQCQLLDLHRSVIYYEPTPKMNDPVLMNTIHELWLEHPFYGYRRVTHVFKRDGYVVNYKRILRLMRLMNLQAIYPKKRLSKPNRDHYIYPYLLKNMVIIKSNQA